MTRQPLTGRQPVDRAIWLVLMLGLVTTALGVVYGIATASSGQGTRGSTIHTMVAAVIGSLGAGAVGAALSIVLTKVADREGRDNLMLGLSHLIGARFTSDDAALKLLRGCWHHYHVTSQDGRYLWRYLQLRFDHWPIVGAAGTWFTISDAGGHSLDYFAEAGVRGNHVVLLMNGRDAGVGAQATEVFPTMVTQRFRTRHCGIGLYQTWDGAHTVGKIILSPEAIVPVSEAGTIAAEDFAQLDEVWRADFESLHTILPTPQPGSTCTGQGQPGTVPAQATAVTEDPTGHDERNRGTNIAAPATADLAGDAPR